MRRTSSPSCSRGRPCRLGSDAVRCRVSVAVRIAREVALGLAAAHGKGIVHRDLKPANLFLTEDGRVKLLDFGIAQQGGPRSPGAVDSTVTASGTVVGTVAYMAPEQIRGERVDSRADIFALGLILYEMLAGRRPFKGSGELDLAAAILRDEPPALPDPVLDGLVRRCLAKAPGTASSRRRTWPTRWRRSPCARWPDGPGGAAGSSWRPLRVRCTRRGGARRRSPPRT